MLHVMSHARGGDDRNFRKPRALKNKVNFIRLGWT